MQPGQLKPLMAAFAVALGAVAAAAVGVAPVSAERGQGPIVLVAASLHEAMNDAASRWAAQGHARPLVSSAASSTLARQIAAGAPADLFVSADVAWVEYLERRGRVAAGTRAVLAGNQLVLIARAGARVRVRIDWRNPRAAAEVLGAGPVAMADPASVPAGRYGEAALRALGLWPALAPRIVRAENVRAALALVERGAAPFGIVYATDVRAARSARVIAAFPPDAHPPIRYVVLRIKGAANAGGEAFRRYLLSQAGQTVLRRHGFVVS